MESISGRETWTETEDSADDLVAEFEAIDENEAGAADEVTGWDSLMEYQPWEEFEEFGEAGSGESDKVYESNDIDESDGYEAYDEEGDDWSENNWEDGTSWDGRDERTEELEREKQFEVLTIPREILEEYDLPELPESLAIMGGTARSVARQVVAGDMEPVRDLDLVYIPELSDSDDKLSDAELDDLSKEYMPDDYMYGRGIQTEELENYFLTRDFTMNQCLIYQDKLMLTRAAYDDLQENIIRPSYDTQPNAETPISEKLFLKALMMKAMLAVAGVSATLEEFGMGQIDEEMAERVREGEDLRLGAPNIAPALNRAMSQGAEVTQEFVKALVESGVVPDYYQGRPLLLAHRIKDKCDDFTYQPDDDWKNEEIYDSLDETIMELPDRRRTYSSAMREAMQEYESYFQIKERETGEYSPEEYEWVNRK